MTLQEIEARKAELLSKIAEAKTQEEIAELVGKSRPYITNTMRLLNLSEQVKKYIEF